MRNSFMSTLSVADFCAGGSDYALPLRQEHSDVPCWVNA
jgi:hypothetical protein